jgi:hypothetical protein
MTADFTKIGQFAKTLFATAQTAFQQWFLDKEPGPELMEERRRLGGGPNCPDCISYAAQGWQPFGSLPEPGQDSYCKSNCQCTVEVRKVSGDNQESKDESWEQSNTIENGNS